MSHVEAPAICDRRRAATVEDALDVERGGEVDACLVDERRPAGAVVEELMDAGVGDRLGGDLAQAPDEIEAGELAPARCRRARPRR